MLNIEVKISIFLKFAEYLSVCFFVKVITTIENLKAQTLIFQEGIGSLEPITLIKISTCLTLLRIAIWLIQAFYFQDHRTRWSIKVHQFINNLTSVAMTPHLKYDGKVTLSQVFRVTNVEF